MKQFDTLPDSALIRQRQLTEGLVPFSGATLWRRVKSGDFPAPIKLNDGNITAWKVGDVRAWLAAQGGAQ